MVIITPVHEVGVFQCTKLGGSNHHRLAGRICDMHPTSSFGIHTVLMLLPPADRLVQGFWLMDIDPRDPSTTPLNFTKSINLALSERGINAMRNAGSEKLLQHVVSATIPMRGRMIHGKKPSGELYEEPQDYDAQGRVRQSNY
jgi:hypothetical protein